jgi:hypothetical protein
MCTRDAIRTISPTVAVSVTGSSVSGERSAAPRSTSTSTSSSG